MRPVKLLTALLLLASPARAAELTYEGALAAAQARSLDAQRAALAVQLADADLALVGYENDPKLTLAGALSDHRPKDASTATQSSRDRVVSATLGMTLYDFGRHASKVEQSEAARDVKALSQEEVKEALRFRVARAYAAVIAAERAVVLARDSVDVSAKRRDAQKANYGKGLRPESDVVQAEVDLGRARLALARAQDDARAARVQLGLLTGDEPLARDGTLPPKTLAGTDPKGLVALAESWQQFDESAAQTRRAKEKEALGADEAAVSASTRPTLSGTLAAQRSGPYGDDLKPLYTGQLQLSWDVPWNGRSRDEERRIGLRRQDLDLQEQVELRARSDRDAAARTTLHAAQGQYAILTEQQKLAERQRTLVQRRYETGKASALEVSAAEADLVSLRLELTKLLATIQAATLDVAEARGVKEPGKVFQ